MANPNRSRLPKGPLTPNQIALSLRPGDLVTLRGRRQRDVVTAIEVVRGEVRYGLAWSIGRFPREALLLVRRSLSSPATLGDRIKVTDGSEGVVCQVALQEGWATSYRLAGTGTWVGACDSFLTEEATTNTLSLALSASMAHA